MRTLLLLSLAMFTSGVAFPQGDSSAAVEGPVTRSVSIDDFDVSGQEVSVGKGTVVHLIWPDGSSVIPEHSSKLFIGQHVVVFQTENDKSAKRIDIWQVAMHAVDGTATIEEVLPGKDLVVRADGYDIHIGATIKLKYEKPFATVADVKPDTALKYKGVLQSNGTVLATSATFFPNEVSPEMLKARKQWAFDPTSVNTDSRQSIASRAFRGTDARYFPLHADAAMQERVNAIGEKLMPAYQKNLDAADKTHIQFKFYVVDAPKNANAYYPFPSGIILLPAEVVEKLTDDSRLAAILADAIACLIESQPIALPLSNGGVARSLVGVAGDIAAFGVVGTSVAAASQVALTRDAGQRARVSLSLMRDAGFDETAAPQAWWALFRDNTKPLTSLTPPDVSIYLYERIAEHQAGAVGGLVGKHR